MKKLKSLIAHMRAAAPYRGIPLQLIDIILHKLIINFSIKDYYYFEFYKQGKSWEEKSRYVALGGSRYWPLENNEIRFTITLTDKYIQKHLFIGFGLPVPRLIATLGPGLEIEGERQFSAFLDRLEQDVIVKSISSAGGKGIWLVSKRDGSLCSAGTPCTREQLWAELSTRIERGYLIEERVRNIGVLARLNPDCLNCFRVVTIKTRDGQWHCAAVSVKIGAPGAVADNNAQGGIQINLDAQGRPYSAYDFGSRELISHDRNTGISLLDVQIEGFRDAVALAMSASRKLHFLGTIGWDIAYTERGALIIEGNPSWGCSSLQRGRPGIITDELARGLKTHHVFGRWDKSRYHPAQARKGRLRRWLTGRR
jgi:hypothetical protein